MEITLTRQSQYGVRVIFDMAYHSNGLELRAKAILRRQRISPSYLQQIFQKLTKAKVLGSKRGPSGGYFLMKEPKDITVGEIVGITEGGLSLVSCERNGKLKKPCGRLNELDSLFCVGCGEEMMNCVKEEIKRPWAGPSYKTIALIIATVILIGFLVKVGAIFLDGKGTAKISSSPPPSTSPIQVDEAKVITVAKNFKCACGGCGELSLETCQCDMPKGAVEEKNFILEKLAEGLTVEQVIELLDKKYGHRV